MTSRSVPRRPDRRSRAMQFNGWKNIRGLRRARNRGRYNRIGQNAKVNACPLVRLVVPSADRKDATTCRDGDRNDIFRWKAKSRPARTRY